MIDILENEELLISSLLILVGLIVAIWQTFIFLKIQSSRSWRETTGEIICSEVVTFANTGEVDKTYKAKIEYKYLVDNKEYTSNKIYFSDKLQSSISKKSNSLVAKYPKDKKVKVYFNPVNYQEAIIERGLNRNVIILFLIGICSMVIGTLLSLDLINLKI